MEKLLKLIKDLTWYNKVEKSKEILRLLTTVFLQDAPEDGNIYGRKDGAWEEVTTGGGLTTPNLQEVTDENPSLTKTIKFAGDPSRTFASSLTGIVIGAGDNYNVDEDAIVKAYSSFSNGEDTLSASLQVQNEVTAGALSMELDTLTNKAIAVLVATNESQGFRASADHSNFLEAFSYTQKVYVDAVIVNTNITASNNRKYNVVATATLTDPTPTEGMGYMVNVINGVATVGGNAYLAGSKVYRFFHSGSWITKNYGLNTSSNFTDDTTASAGGIQIGDLYHTAGVVKIRLS